MDLKSSIQITCQISERMYFSGKSIYSFCPIFKWVSNPTNLRINHVNGRISDVHHSLIKDIFGDTEISGHSPNHTHACFSYYRE